MKPNQALQPTGDEPSAPTPAAERRSLGRFLVTSMRIRMAVGIATIVLSVSSCSTTRENILLCTSPDNVHVAVFYREFAGGAAGFQYEYVAVKDREGTSETVVLKMKGGYDVVLTWLSPKKLEIAYPDSARVDDSQSDPKQENQLNWTTSLKRLESKDGLFTSEKTRCGN